MLDERVLTDRNAAQAQGYYFASARDHYQQLFTVAATQLSLPARDVRGWLKPAEQRAPWLLKGDLRASAGLLLLEQAAQRRAELRARDVLKRQLLAAADSAETRSLRAAGAEWAVVAPGTLLQDGGYGLPLGDEQVLLSAAVATASAQGYRHGRHCVCSFTSSCRRSSVRKWMRSTPIWPRWEHTCARRPLVRLLARQFDDETAAAAAAGRAAGTATMCIGDGLDHRQAKPAATALART